VFVDGSTLLGVVTLDGTGRAVLTTAALPPGLHLIRAAYLGTAGFLAGHSPKIYQLVVRA
jgi:hypothetical protein